MKATTSRSKPRLPSPFKVCEGCEHFRALTDEKVIYCEKMGQIHGAVFACGVRNRHRGKNEEPKGDNQDKGEQV